MQRPIHSFASRGLRMEALPVEMHHYIWLIAGALASSVIWGMLWLRSAARHAHRIKDQALQHKDAMEAAEARCQALEKQLAVAEAELRQATELRHQLREKENHLMMALRDNAGLKTRLESEQEHYQQQLSLLKEARENLAREFENLANRIFESKQQQFAQSSKSTLEGTLNPLREQLTDFRRQVEEVYHKESAERNKLLGQITVLQQQTQKIGEDAVNLATALKGNNKAQGDWGEIVLERLLEQSGLQKGREYETQVTLEDEEGRRRKPDVIVRLPENKDIVIDSKVSLLSYEKYCNAADDEERERALRGHVASLRAHIDDLSKKNYEKLPNIRSLDFVFIFVPVEAAFMLALQHEPGLFNYAYDKHIVLVSPTTLLATLRTVENIWRYEKQNKNAERIADMAGKLHDQFALVLESLGELGANIERAQEAYVATQKRLSSGRGNLYRRIQELEKLGARTKRQLPRRDEAFLLEHESAAEDDVLLEEDS